MMVRGLLLIAALSLSVPRCERPQRIATLNLENYPRHSGQGAAAFAMIKDLKVSAVAMQEITKPDAFTAEAKKHLGAQWDFVWAARGGMQRVGLLYNTDKLAVIGTEIHEETLLHRNAKPAFEAVVIERGQTLPIHLFIVHLKATDASESIRAAQLLALAPVLAARRASGARVVFLGDFNSTNEGDRVLLDSLSGELGLFWASEGLPCTNYWARKDGCRSHALDHVLTWSEPASIEVGGGCATDGCEVGDQCPIYRSEVSDHCPVIVEMSFR
jgi:endonuclease/exonuclease/phosphatase family metal-dependent hydrolase